MKKPRVAIITITNSTDNYGNVFQNYATQELLKGMDLDAATIRNYSFAKWRIGGLYLLPKLVIDKKAGGRSFRFMLFRKRRIKYWPEIVTESNSNLSRLRDKYDFFICGSDQLWNPMYRCNRNWDFSLLRFARHHQKIAFSVSFGISELTSDEQSIFKSDINDFFGISVREKSGCDIVEKLTGKTPALLLDPAMLLPREKWFEIEKPIRKLQGKKVICIYVLGDKTEQLKQRIDSIIHNDNYEVVDITDKNGKFYYPSPEKFLWIVHNSSYVLTDSFHCTLFSILFGKRFEVFQRNGEAQSTFDRIQTLLKKFGYENSEEGLKENIVNAILSEERNKAKLFIRNSMPEYF